MATKLLIVFISCFLLVTPAIGAQKEIPQGDFIYASGKSLMHAGKVYRFVGCNTYYLMAYEASPDQRKYVDEIFDDAADMKLSVIRTWAFNDGKRQWSHLQSSPGSYKESTFAALDRIIVKAREHNIRLILTLVNDLNDYGGAKQYLDWSASAKTKNHTEFYTDTTCRQYYKDHAKAILTRVNSITGIEYRNDPTILAWQLVNEPRVDTDPTGDILYAWEKEMSEHIKSIDKNHLVMSGDEGFYSTLDKYDWKYNGSKGQDFVRNHSIKTIDIASCHLWPSSSKYNLDADKVKRWIKKHAEDAATLGKPLVIDEFGEYRGYNGDSIERDAFYRLVYKLADEYRLSGTNFWLLLHDDYRKHDDGYGIFNPEDVSTVSIIKKAARRTTSR